jgi:DNA-binding beta-propeller fold protein YncE
MTSMISIPLNPAPAITKVAAGKIYFTSVSSAVSVIDLQDPLAKPVTKPLPTGVSLSALAVAPDGRQLFLGDRNGKAVVVVDSSSFSVKNTLDVGAEPVSLAVAPDGEVVYVFTGDPARSEYRVFGFNPKLERPWLFSLPIDHQTLRTLLAVGGPEERLYAAQQPNPNGEATLCSIPRDVTGNRPCVAFPGTLFSVAVTPDGTAFVSCNPIPPDVRNGTVTVLEPKELAVKATIPVELGPMALTAAPDGGAIYLAAGREWGLWKLDPENLDAPPTRIESVKAQGDLQSPGIAGITSDSRLLCVRTFQPPGLALVSV